MIHPSLRAGGPGVLSLLSLANIIGTCCEYIMILHPLSSGLVGLVSCPFCPYQTIMENDQDKVFTVTATSIIFSYSFLIFNFTADSAFINALS